MTSAPVIPILFGGLVLWSVYRRVRRNVGRQKLRPRRIVTSIVLFSVVSTVLVSALIHNLNLTPAIAGGLAIGVSLGFIGLRLTRFETNEQGHFYTPNTHIGLALSLLFVGRLLYRFWVLRDASAANGHPPVMQSPLTYFILGLVVGYYIVYYIGLFIHAQSNK